MKLQVVSYFYMYLKLKVKIQKMKKNTEGVGFYLKKNSFFQNSKRHSSIQLAGFLYLI